MMAEWRRAATAAGVAPGLAAADDSSQWRRGGARRHAGRAVRGARFPAHDGSAERRGPWPHRTGRRRQAAGDADQRGARPPRFPRRQSDRPDDPARAGWTPDRVRSRRRRRQRPAVRPRSTAGVAVFRRPAPGADRPGVPHASAFPRRRVLCGAHGRRTSRAAPERPRRRPAARSRCAGRSRRHAGPDRLEFDDTSADVRGARRDLLRDRGSARRNRAVRRRRV